VIIRNLNIFCIAIDPAKTDAKLVINPNRVLACALLPERVKSIAWRGSQVPEFLCLIDHEQLTSSHTDKIRRKSFWGIASRYVFGGSVLERSDHERIIP